jgi:hypothetical protein
MSTLSHSAFVCRLYRRALRNCRDWYIGVDAYRRISLAVRYQFERYRNLDNPEEVRFLMACTESILNRSRHPEPILAPKSVGGAAYEREVVVPKHIRDHGYDDFKDTVL